MFNDHICHNESFMKLMQVIYYNILLLLKNLISLDKKYFFHKLEK